MLEVTNTMTGKKEQFVPAIPGKVSLYVCGITPYDFAHMGHGRCYVAFDVLYRLLLFLGYDVIYCRNYTDIDDKILTRTEAKFNDKSMHRNVTDRFIKGYKTDMAALNCLVPTYEPRVTENMESIIAFISGLIAKKKAYEVDGDVYFSIRSFPQYGGLSRHDTSYLYTGEGVDPESKKQDPHDFALWKKEKEGTFWKTPWGWGRPGWHIECSALAAQYLGKEIDIHAGGRDLIFPHHENEIAQSEALHGVPFARYWMHNGFVRIDKEKMSKSTGNFFTLRDIFEKYNPMVVRFYFLNHQYRAPLDFSFDQLDALAKSYKKISSLFALSHCDEQMSNNQIKKSSIVQRMLTFLCDDLNTPGMLGVLFQNFSLLQKDEKERCAVKLFLQRVVGLTLIPLQEEEKHLTHKVKQLIVAREKARASKVWARADEIRDQLYAMGYTVQDKKT